MLTSIRSERLVVISDLHLGNPFSRGRHEAIRFLKWAASQKFDICINGDGLEIAQVSFSKLAVEMPEVVQTLRELNKMGCNVYYIVGNHDMALEHFLEDWGTLKVCPFLNLLSGKKRVRIEHGHLYDPFFVSYPTLYEVSTKLAGFLLAIHPNFYRLWISLEKFQARLRARKTGIIGEPPEFAEAAHEICRRGFDTVIFGHTHHRGEFTLPEDKQYLNSGSWLLTCDYVEIVNGHAELKTWQKKSA